MTISRKPDNDMDYYNDPIRSEQDRKIDELIGLCRGISSDGELVDSEIEYLHRWLQFYARDLDIWPASDLLPRVTRILSDGVVDENERFELMGYLRAYIGDSEDGLEKATTRLPIDDPPPILSFLKKVFVFSGLFAFGTQEECGNVTTALGGTVDDKVGNRTDYLVVGERTNHKWKHSPYGRNIENAKTLKTQGHPIFIIEEQHWRKFVKGPRQPALFP